MRAGDRPTMCRGPSASPHRPAQVECRKALQCQSVANLTNNSLFQRLREVNASCSTCQFWGFQVHPSQLPSPSEGGAVGHDFSNYPPVVRSLGVDWLGVEEKRFGAACPGAIAPRGEDSVTRREAAGKVGDIVKAGRGRRHYDVCEKRVLGMYVE